VNPFFKLFTEKKKYYRNDHTNEIFDLFINAELDKKVYLHWILVSPDTLLQYFFNQESEPLPRKPYLKDSATVAFSCFLIIFVENKDDTK